MKSLKEILAEAVLMPSYGPELKSDLVKTPTKWKDPTRVHPGMEYYSKHNRMNKVSETSTGHHVYESDRDVTNNNKKTYVAWNPKTQQHDIELTGTETKNKNGTKTFREDYLSGRAGSTLKAHEFYKHLILNHNLIIHGGEHSPGGRKVWKRLYDDSMKKDSKLTVHGWDIHNDKGVNLYGKPKHTKYYGNQTARTNLVAIKRI